MLSLPSEKRARRLRDAIRLAFCALAVVVCATAASVTRAGAIDLVRMEGTLRAKNPPDAATQLSLAIGKATVPFSVVKAQRISGIPAEAPEIFSALGPGPPPVRVEGRKAMVKKIVDAPADTQVTITGNLNTGAAFMTLMDVQIQKSAGAK